ncbi:hypothetical protein [Natrinema soli]|uniref:CARDB domain-containing protein n=1 Tax=Natrinema soli TaxID=1930624 RepID=A0ABD5SS31_9EURY|nr:hypothetical protein [Natrinema soli]
MDRRTLLVSAGLGVGLAGCLNVNGNETDGGNGTNDGSDRLDSGTDSETNGTEGGTNGSADDSGAENDSSDGETDTGDENSDDDSDTETDDSNGETKRSVTFDSCSRATVSGTFEAGDVAYASTGFYADDGLFGDTILEDGITFGEDVAAPFSGTVVFEIADGSNVRAGADEITVEVPDYGSTGTVLSSLTTRKSDYQRVSATHENPRASECLSEIEPDGGNDSSGDDSDSGDATFAIGPLETNAPIDSGEFLEVSVTVENTGGAAGRQELELRVGNSAELVERQSVSLDAGERTVLSTGYETPVIANDHEFPVRVESADDAATRSVLVYGRG